MRERIGHYLQVYRSFLSTCAVEAMSYRLHFLLLILMDLFFYFSSLASVSFIYDHVASIGPWNREELLFFVSVMLAIDQWHMSFISESFWMFPQTIRMGILDFILIRPISSLFICFFRHFRISSFLNIFVTWGFIFYFGQKIHLTWGDFVMLPFLMLLGFFLLIIVEMIIACSMFWMLEGMGVNFLRMELQKLSRWPDFIYGSLTRKFLMVFLPILLVGNAPVRFLFNRQDWWPLVGLCLSVLVFGVVLQILWQWGLRAYESASS